MSRQAKYEQFVKFAEKAKGWFNEFSNSSKDHKHLNEYAPLESVFGGRDGGIDDNKFEVFYGYSIIGTEYSREKFPPTPRIKTAEGATLRYDRTDGGMVICTMFPSETKSQKALEDGIVLGHYFCAAHISKCRARWHWYCLCAYMQVTFVDGNPSILHKLHVFALRTFNKRIIDTRVTQRNIITFIGVIAKYVLTVGLSGCLLMIIQECKSSNANTPKVQLATESTLVKVQQELLFRDSIILDLSKTLKQSIDSNNALNKLLLKNQEIYRSKKIKKSAR